jgi:ATP-binding protein involved in chromosome partitioning
MYQKLNIAPMGPDREHELLRLPQLHHEADIFGHGGGERLAEQLGIPFLGRLPVYQPIREGSDTGYPSW